MSRHRHHTLLLIIGLFVTGSSLSQIKPVSIAAIDSLMAQDAKPILLLLTTDWCQYCQMQKLQIRKNKKFAEHSDNFHYVEFDAENKATIRLQGKDYVYQPTGANIGTHELAIALNGPNRLAYPTWVLLDKDYQVLFRQGSVLRTDEINELLEAIQRNKTANYKSVN